MSISYWTKSIFFCFSSFFFFHPFSLVPLFASHKRINRFQNNLCWFSFVPFPLSHLPHSHLQQNYNHCPSPCAFHLASSDGLLKGERRDDDDDGKRRRDSSIWSKKVSRRQLVHRWRMNEWYWEDNDNGRGWRQKGNLCTAANWSVYSLLAS